MEMFEEANLSSVSPKVPELYILTVGNNESIRGMEIAECLRDKNIYVERDIFGRSFKAQLKYADKIKAKNLLVIGENELNSGIAKIKNMENGEELEIKLDVDNIIKNIK